MKALYRVPPDDPIVSAFIPLSTDVIACHGIPASNVYAENPPKSSGKPGALHLPDSPAPVQARKREGQGKNPFLFAMLFEKNIEIFFEWQPVGVVCFFLLPPAFPRVDGGRPGGGGVAGGCNTGHFRHNRQYHALFKRGS